MDDECRFDWRAHWCETHDSQAKFCFEGAAALQGRVETAEAQHTNAMHDLGFCQERLDEAKARVRELEGQLKQREQEMQQHIMTHAEALSEMGEKLARAEAMVGRLREALSLLVHDIEEGWKHSPECAMFSEPEEDDSCSCGPDLDAALECLSGDAGRTFLKELTALRRLAEAARDHQTARRYGDGKDRQEGEHRLDTAIAALSPQEPPGATKETP